MKTKELNDKIIRHLKDKHDAFLGTEGQKSRDDFKNGLSWAINTIETLTRDAEFEEDAKRLTPNSLLSVKNRYIGGSLTYTINKKKKKINTTTIRDIVIITSGNETCLTIMGENFIYGFKLPDLYMEKIDGRLFMKSSIKGIKCCISENHLK